MIKSTGRTLQKYHYRMVETGASDLWKTLEFVANSKRNEIGRDGGDTGP